MQCLGNSVENLLIKQPLLTTKFLRLIVKQVEMPKSRKKKNADFQKVKLKVGKKLPKGLNETDLSFKSRQLQLPKNKDFLSNKNEPQTRRKLTLEVKFIPYLETCITVSVCDHCRQLTICQIFLAELAQILDTAAARISGKRPLLS